MNIYRYLVKQRQLSPIERLSQRLGYMGTAFIIMSPYMLAQSNVGAYTYIIGGVISIPQVFLAKQWNLVLINLNVIVGYGIFILTN